MPEKPQDRSPVNASPASGYAGDVSVNEAWRLLVEDPGTVLVDVRTMAEWMYVGTPDLTSIAKRPLFIEWQTFPDRTLNPDFLGQLSRSIPDQNATVLFSCRSGARSASAAMMAAAKGYARSYNIAEGFEGDPDGTRHRGTTGGWKAKGLPWVQS